MKPTFTRLAHHAFFLDTGERPNVAVASTEVLWNDIQRYLTQAPD
jgi:hypothetical protein